MRSDRPTLHACLIAALMACGTGVVVAAEAARPALPVPVPVQVKGAWIRWLPGDLPAAGYATLTNVGDEPLTLIGASTRDYGGAMFHQSRNEHGIERMLPVESVRLAPHSTVSFAPESYHIMLMQPQRVIRPGDHILVTLHFAGDRSLRVPFEVRRPDGGAGRVGHRS
jgi:copper(I)-binding protein